MKTKFLIIISALTLVVSSCSYTATDNSENITVSILPLKYIVDGITSGNIPVDILVPPGSSPETYEPTSKQIISLNNSPILFITGLIDFENELVTKLAFEDQQIVSISDGISVLSGSCGHDHGEGHSHSHGIDPHIWTSPVQLKIIARNTYKALSLLYPDSTHFESNFSHLEQKLDELDKIVRTKIDNSNIKSFVIYHPALTYYANDYGLEQISIENEGKEPSVEHLRGIIKKSKGNKIRNILYQKEFSKNTVETLSRDLDVEIVEIDPLAEDIYNNIIYITNIIVD